MKDRYWPILLKKSVLAGAAFPEFKKRTIWTLLRENQGSSVFRTAQISTQATLFCGQKSQRDFFNRIDP